MSPRPRTTFNKRQKEQARQEKRRAKEQRKLQRKLESQSAALRVESTEATPDEGAVSESPSEPKTETLLQSSHNH